VVIGSIEASLRRIAHYDYWSDAVRRSVLIDANADLLLYGNAERAIVELTHRIAGGQKISDITDIRGTAFVLKTLPRDAELIDETQLPESREIETRADRAEREPEAWPSDPETPQPVTLMPSCVSEPCVNDEQRGAGFA
jgi:radical SAM superfamily enzyme YgiQ (UPF0313 family)